MAEILGAFEQAVLLAVFRLRSDAYGRAVLNEVEKRVGRGVSAGAVYATLNRLEAKGFVTSEVVAGTEVRDGRARRYYAVAASGVQALNDARTALTNVWRGIAWPLKARG